MSLLTETVIDTGQDETASFSLIMSWLASSSGLRAMLTKVISFQFLQKMKECNQFKTSQSCKNKIHIFNKNACSIFDKYQHIIKETNPFDCDLL